MKKLIARLTTVLALLFAETGHAGKVIDALYLAPNKVEICNTFVEAYAFGFQEFGKGRESAFDVALPPSVTDEADADLFRQLVAVGIITARIHVESSGAVREDLVEASNKMFLQMIRDCNAVKGHPSYLSGLPNITNELMEQYTDFYYGIREKS